MHCRLQFVPDRTVPSIPSRRVAVVFTRDFDLGPKPARLDFLLGGGNIRVHVFPTLGIKPDVHRPVIHHLHFVELEIGMPFQILSDDLLKILSAKLNLVLDEPLVAVILQRVYIYY
jgi:hypothetical protein